MSSFAVMNATRHTKLPQLIVWMQSSERALKIFAILSFPALANFAPSGEAASAMTQSVCSLISRTLVPFVVSHTRRVLSQLQVTALLPCRKIHPKNGFGEVVMIETCGDDDDDVVVAHGTVIKRSNDTSTHLVEIRQGPDNCSAVSRA